MRAVVIATGYTPAISSLLYYRPTPLLNIADRPVIFHVLDFLTQAKISKFELVLSHLPHMIEEKLDDGRRWGISITYHLAKDPEFPFSTIRAAAQAWDNERIVFALGDTLPKIDPHTIIEHMDKEEPFFWMYPSHEWTGWGLINAAQLGRIAPKTTLQAFFNQFGPHYKSLKAAPFLNVQSLPDLKKTNLKFITHEHPANIFPTTARMVDPGIWVSRGVSLHPLAKIVSPVFIGENCQIKDNTQIGPNAIIEKNCIIDSQSHIENSLVLQRSYVGENLDVRNSIIDRNLLINLSLETHVTIRDDFILCELKPPSLLSYPLRLLERAGAAFIYCLLYPIYLWMKKTHDIKQEEMLLLPASEDIGQWKSFPWLTFEPKPDHIPTSLQIYFKRLPLLVNLIGGEIHLVGVIPRSIEDVQKLPPDWQKLYLRSKIGLITLSDLDTGPYPTTDDCYTAEIYYAIHMSFWYDLKLFLRWLKNKVAKLFRKTRGQHA